MKTILKRITSILLMLSFISTSTISSFAQTSTDGIVRENIRFEKGSIEGLLESSSKNSIASRQTTDSSKKIVYTYVENGEMYRVHGEVNNNLTYSNSSIFNVKNGEEILVGSESVSVNNNIITTTINQNGNITVDTLDLNDDSDKIKESSDHLFKVNSTWDGFPVSDSFQEWATFKGSKGFTATTAASITIIINQIVKVSKIDKKAQVVVTSIAGIVNYLVQKNSKRVYYKEVVSFRWTQIPNVTLQQKAVERTIRTFYTDSNYATVVSSTTTLSYAKGYKE